MRRLLVLLAAAFALLGAGWLLRTQASRPDTRAPVAEGPDATASEAPLESPEAAQRRPLIAETIAPELAMVPALPPLDVLVTDRISGEPVEGAEVRWANLRETGPIYDSSRPLEHPDFETLLANAPRVTTDAAGIVHIDTSLFPGIVVARLGQRYGGQLVTDRNQNPIPIRILRDIGLRVQTVDASGRPIPGVPVALRGADARRGESDVSEGISAGPDGIVSFAHLQTSRPPSSMPKRVRVHVAAPGGEAGGVVVDLENPPPDPVQLVVPAYGSILVRIHDALGNEVQPTFMNLAAAADLDAEGFLPMNARAFQASVLERGRALFPVVPVGVEVYVAAFYGPREVKSRGMGPGVQGEQQTLDFDVGEPWPELTGRLVDSEGRAIANCDLQYLIDARAGGATNHGSEPLRTDAEGRFHALLSLDVTNDVTGTATFRPYGPGFDLGESVMVVLDGRVGAGSNDLGDLVIATPIVLASGRAVDDLGAPVGGALLGVEQSEAGNVAWRNLPQGSNSAADGTFQVRSTSRTGALRLLARCGGHLVSATVEVAPGATDVVLVLPRAGGLGGSVLLDEAARQLDLRIEIVRVGAAKSTDPLQRVLERGSLRTDGSFELLNLAPGPVDVAIRVAGEPEPVRVIRGVEVRAGETTLDPRLTAIDLRGALPAAGHD